MSRGLFLVLLGLALPAPPARACASCGCGDQTLTALGVEKPFRNRVRIGAEATAAGHTAGLPGLDTESWSLRSAVFVSWSPSSWLTLLAQLPLVTTWTRATEARPLRTVGLGDAELLGRLVVYRDRRFSPRHLLGLTGGLKLPTGPRVSDESGRPAAEDDQPGSGSWDPFVGVSYGWFHDPFAVFASASYRLTTIGRRDYRRGASLGATAGVQLQPWRWGAAGLAIEAHFAEADTRRGPIDPPARVAIADSGGALLALTPSLMVAPHPDLLIRLSLRIPVVEAWNGAQREAPGAALSMIFDL